MHTSSDMIRIAFQALWLPVLHVPVQRAHDQQTVGCSMLISSTSLDNVVVLPVTVPSLTVGSHGALHHHHDHMILTRC